MSVVAVVYRCLIILRMVCGGGQITLAMWCLWADMCQHVHVALVLFRRSCGVCVAFMCVLFMFALVVCVVYVCVGCACAGFA